MRSMQRPDAPALLIPAVAAHRLTALQPNTQTFRATSLLPIASLWNQRTVNRMIPAIQIPAGTVSNAEKVSVTRIVRMVTNAETVAIANQLTSVKTSAVIPASNASMANVKRIAPMDRNAETTASV